MTGPYQTDVLPLLALLAALDCPTGSVARTVAPQQGHKLDEGEYVRGAKTGEWVIYGPDGAESSTETWSAGVRTRVVPREPSRWLPLQGDAAFCLLVGNTNVMAAALYLGYARGGAP